MISVPSAHCSIYNRRPTMMGKCNPLWLKCTPQILMHFKQSTYSLVGWTKFGWNVWDFRNLSLCLFALGLCYNVDSRWRGTMSKEKVECPDHGQQKTFNWHCHMNPQNHQERYHSDVSWLHLGLRDVLWLNVSSVQLLQSNQLHRLRSDRSSTYHKPHQAVKYEHCKPEFWTLIDVKIPQ